MVDQLLLSGTGDSAPFSAVRRDNILPAGLVHSGEMKAIFYGDLGEFGTIGAILPKQVLQVIGATSGSSNGLLIVSQKCGDKVNDVLLSNRYAC